MTISLDNYRSVSTDATGGYLLANVPEGRHEVTLDMEHLHTDYEPGPLSKALAIVEPRGLVRADFSVIRLVDLPGKVVAAVGVQLDGMVIRLADTKRYTSPSKVAASHFTTCVRANTKWSWTWERYLRGFCWLCPPA